MFDDTIASIITAQGKSAISVIRISGKKCVEIINKIFKGPDMFKVDSHTVQYGHIIYKEEIIDEVLISKFLAPRTFTKEDIIEVSCHGGTFVANKILKLILLEGARLAEPGEFTKRAFLNGRIDLTKAESIMDIINAESDIALKSANKSLSGETFDLVTKLRKELIKIIADIEVNIDYPEYDELSDITKGSISPKIDDLIKNIKKVLKYSDRNKIIKEGVNIVLVGKPNVGKSSLLNILSKEEKAIVTNIPGTTRDLVESRVVIDGIVVNLIDTAGIRDSSDEVELIGINKSLNSIDKADLILLLVDSSEALEEEDKLLLDKTKNLKRIVIRNKLDLMKDFNKDICDLSVSTKSEEGINELYTKIKEILMINNFYDDNYLSNTRHIVALEEALNSIISAKDAVSDDVYIDLANVDLHNSYNKLGEIIGDTSNTSILDELFASFCLGK